MLGYLKVVLSKLGGATASILLSSASVRVIANTLVIACVLVTFSCHMLAIAHIIYCQNAPKPLCNCMQNCFQNNPQNYL
jgi:hypothetical protein